MLREFYYSLKQKKDMRTRQLLLRRAYDRLTRDERKFVAGRYDGLQAPRLVMCIGVTGTGVGSRITCHLRYGGKQTTCFSPVVRLQVKVMIKGEMKTMFVQGSSICYNSNCSSYKLGSNTKNRDVDAAVNIALTGMAILLTGNTLPAFSFDTSQYQLGNQNTAFPSVTDVSLVPVIAGLPKVSLNFWGYDSHRIYLIACIMYRISQNTLRCPPCLFTLT
jgi:hypothetical protein